MKLKLLVGAIALATAGLASAATVVTFAQTGATNSVTATAIGTNQNEFTTTDSLVTVGTGYVGSAYLTFDFLSDAGSFFHAGSLFGETLSGTFSIYTGTGLTGTKVLAGGFTSNVGSLTESTNVFSITAGTTGFAPSDLTFTSDIFSTGSLGLQRGLSFSFTNVSVVGGGALTAAHQFNAFTSNESGNASADPFVPPPTVPEPATLLLAGLGLMGVVASRRGKKA